MKMRTIFCEDQQKLLINLLNTVSGLNKTSWTEAIERQERECSTSVTDHHSPTLTFTYNKNLDLSFAGSDMDILQYEAEHGVSIPDTSGLGITRYGVKVYAYVTPIIFVLGLVGSLVSLRVFATRKLRTLSASFYLSAISVADCCVLSTYVLMDWVNRGLPEWPGGYRLEPVNTPGVCEAFLLTSYTCRLVSVWLIVLFTMERYIAVCRPFHRRVVCTRAVARRAVGVVIILGMLVSLYKPLMSGVYPSLETSGTGHIGSHTYRRLSDDIISPETLKRFEQALSKTFNQTEANRTWSLESITSSLQRRNGDLMTSDSLKFIDHIEGSSHKSLLDMQQREEKENPTRLDSTGDGIAPTQVLLDLSDLGENTAANDTSTSTVPSWWFSLTSHDEDNDVTSSIYTTASSVQDVEQTCGRNPAYGQTYAYVALELIYGLLLTAVPFIPLCALNAAILKTLLARPSTGNSAEPALHSSQGSGGGGGSGRLTSCRAASAAAHSAANVPSRQLVRREFTLTMLAVSVSFVLFNIPYFALWVQQFIISFYESLPRPSVVHAYRDKLFYAKTIFYANYAVNFFLYCLTGGYFRSALARVFIRRGGGRKGSAFEWGGDGAGRGAGRSAIGTVGRTRNGGGGIGGRIWGGSGSSSGGAEYSGILSKRGIELTTISSVNMMTSAELV